MALDVRSLPAVSVPALGVIGAWFSTGGSGPCMDVPPVLWTNEKRMKQELVAWAKAVASMAIRESMQC
ncbi:hypothetical protein PR202_gb15460 [Eleusine coracana subsp. coracana]|uniref:Uncharacterized protein n=1 Tax=Eleusine coracana subsp. coracana TaxID=191504 RepID=A0AAV5EVJ7_ELECO|nr:hypothetical protein PR202_gb15460 [Eleusine coracana subsp. coracana]